MHRRALLDFRCFGLPYSFAVQPGAPARGLATGASAPSLLQTFGAEPAYVWPSTMGSQWDIAVEPQALAAAARDEQLYALLALIDTLRLGWPCEVSFAHQMWGDLVTLDSLGR